MGPGNFTIVHAYTAGLDVLKMQITASIRRQPLTAEPTVVTPSLTHSRKARSSRAPGCEISRSRRHGGDRWVDTFLLTIEGGLSRTVVQALGRARLPRDYPGQGYRQRIPLMT